MEDGQEEEARIPQRGDPQQEGEREPQPIQEKRRPSRKCVQEREAEKMREKVEREKETEKRKEKAEEKAESERNNKRHTRKVGQLTRETWKETVGKFRKLKGEKPWKGTWKMRREAAEEVSKPRAEPKKPQRTRRRIA